MCRWESGGERGEGGKRGWGWEDLQEQKDITLVQLEDEREGGGGKKGGKGVSKGEDGRDIVHHLKVRKRERGRGTCSLVPIPSARLPCAVLGTRLKNGIRGCSFF